MAKYDKDEFFYGVLVALGYVYDVDMEILAEKIVSDTGPAALLRVARANGDSHLPNLRTTVNLIRRKVKDAGCADRV